MASVCGAPMSVSHNATMFANPVSCSALKSSAPRLPMPQQARFTGLLEDAPNKRRGVIMEAAPAAIMPFRKDRRGSRVAGEFLQRFDFIGDGVISVPVSLFSQYADFHVAERNLVAVFLQ